jgi:hypothetical protein
MAVKVTTNQTESVEKNKYPILGIFPDGTIILFSSINEGTILKSESKQSIGQYSSNRPDYRHFGPDYNWVPYTGTITLSNEEL